MTTLEIYQNKYDPEIYYLTLNTYPDTALAIYKGCRDIPGAVNTISKEDLLSSPTRANSIHPLSSVDVLNILEELNKDTDPDVISDFKKEFMKAFTE